MAATLVGPLPLAPTGTTGNNTHTGINVNPPDGSTIFNFIVEAVGGTPTVTFKIQGCVDAPTVTDANVTWFDIPYFPANSDTLATATQTVTATGKTTFFLDIASGSRLFTRFRLVTTANTNVTYRCEAFSLCPV